MEKEIDNKLNAKNIKPTAMRQLILQILTKQKTAISLPELESKFDKADKATLYRTLKTFEKNKWKGGGAWKHFLWLINNVAFQNGEIMLTHVCVK